jgi:hypothetical protein
VIYIDPDVRDYFSDLERKPPRTDIEGVLDAVGYDHGGGRRSRQSQHRLKGKKLFGAHLPSDFGCKGWIDYAASRSFSR